MIGTAIGSILLKRLSVGLDLFARRSVPAWLSSHSPQVLLEKLLLDVLLDHAGRMAHVDLTSGLVEVLLRLELDLGLGSVVEVLAPSGQLLPVRVVFD